MFTHIAKIIPKAIRKYGVTRQARAALVCEKFRKLAPQVLPPEILAHVRPKHFKNKILVLGVSHPVYAEEISRYKHKLQALINGEFKKETLKDIRTTVESFQKP